jgi:hypothetical protein
VQYSLDSDKPRFYQHGRLTYRSMIFVRLSSFTRLELHQRHTFPKTYRCTTTVSGGVSSSAADHIREAKQNDALFRSMG